MKILLQWLVERAWIFYVVCAIGIIFYGMRAWAAQRERALSLFTLEREMATAQLMRAWMLMFVFVAIGGLVFLSTTFMLPTLVEIEEPTPTPTFSPGLLTSPNSAESTSAPGALVPTLTPTVTDTPTPTAPPQPTVASPTPPPTDTPLAMSGEVHIRFGDFGELVGYELATTEVVAGQPLVLTLYWQGTGNTLANYLVFTHLLATDGHLIAQHDGVPANGTRPTSTWSSGELIIDPHPMTFQETGYAGLAQIRVGLYDPAQGRVLTHTGEDSVLLPITITVLAP